MEQLRKRSHGRRFVAFHDEDENVVNQSLTLQMLRQARRRETPHHQKLADALFQLYAVGDWPSAVYVECPIHPGVLLSDGYCDECGQGWEGVSHEARAFVRLMSGDLSNQSVFVRKAVIKMALEGLDALRTEFPKVSRQYDSLEREGKLPSLRRRLSSEGGRQDPFGGNKRY